MQAKERSYGELIYDFERGMFRHIHIVIAFDEYEGMLSKLLHQLQQISSFSVLQVVKQVAEKDDLCRIIPSESGAQQAHGVGVNPLRCRDAKGTKMSAFPKVYIGNKKGVFFGPIRGAVRIQPE